MEAFQHYGESVEREERASKCSLLTFIDFLILFISYYRSIYII